MRQHKFQPDALGYCGCGLAKDSPEHDHIMMVSEESLQLQREALERPLLAEIDSLRLRVAFWRKAAYGIHNESCSKPECMADLEAKQPVVVGRQHGNS